MRRRRGLPTEVARLLEAGERVLASATALHPDSGRRRLAPVVLAATDRRLIAPQFGDSIPWDRVVRVSWDDPHLDVDYLAPAGGRARVPIELVEAGDLPARVHERVDASTLMQRRTALVGDRGVRLVARRSPGGGGVHWVVIFDAGLDPDDPEVRAAADHALAELRASVGI